MEESSSMRNEDIVWDTLVEQAALGVGGYAMLRCCKEPVRTSHLTDTAWVDEVLQDQTCCFQQFWMMLTVFVHLCETLWGYGLTDSNCRLQEKVGMFLWMVGHAETSRHAQERFQHSGETISRHFHEVLDACYTLANDIIKPLDSQFTNVHTKISQNPRYHPFKNAVGAIDGTHVRCFPPPGEQAAYFNRKGYTSQNVMAACDWDICFTFVLAGWEGSAHDSRVFAHAISTPRFQFPHPPPGKYYLVDAGYPLAEGYLAPYRSERYHLAHFRHTRGTQQSANERFNYVHSSLRSTIERSFGVWKNKFEIVNMMRSYDMKTQVKIVCATMALHNFIKRNSIHDLQFAEHEDDNYVLDDNDEDDNAQAYTNIEEMAGRLESAWPDSVIELETEL